MGAIFQYLSNFQNFRNFLLRKLPIEGILTNTELLGVALNNSPAGLASYITEKFITWTNPDYKNRLDGGLKEKFTYTQILDNIMIYWITGSITTSMRFYSESVNKQQDALSAE